MSTEAVTSDAFARTAATVIARTVDDVSVLVEREAPGLLAYFLRRVDSRDDAADLLGDTLVVAWRRRSAIPGDDTQARMWLYGVARKVLGGHRRGARRRGALTDRLREQLAAAPVTTTKGGAADDVPASLGRLAELDREIIRLAYWEGFSLVEIAGILGQRPSTVRSRHARAMAKLRTALESNDSATG